MSKSKVGIVIVSHNNRDILSQCLDSIRKQSYKDYKTYLFDNDSTDGTGEFVKKNYPEIHFIELLNKGPAEKRNIGISISNSKYLVFMDSDAQLTKDWLKKAVEYMELHNNVGLLGGKILDKDGKLIDSAGGLIAKNFSALDIGYGEKDIGQYESFKRAGYLKSATVITRGKMIEEIGGFDKEYFYDFEDTDLGLRANITGWDVIFNPDLISYHLGHYTMKRKPRKKESFMHNRNKISTILKNYQAKTILLYGPFLLTSFFYNVFFKKQRYEVLRAYTWNFINIKKILEKRKRIQNKRKIPDSKMFNLIKSPMTSSNSQNNNYLKFIRKIRNNNLSNITFFITSKCNSRCKHCFYWKSLNTKKDLTLQEIENILSKFYGVDSVLLSGGEPFIRQDFVQIVDLLVKYLNCKVITIPTNGLMGKKIIEDTKEILKKYPCVKFIINFSLDGTENYHDYIRGIKGNFNRTIKVIKELNKLKKLHSNLGSVSVNTVITKENTKDLPELIKRVKKVDVDDHFFDLIRGEHQNLLSLPDFEELKKINTLRYETRKYYNKKNSKNTLKRIFEDLKDRHIIITQMDVLKGKKWNFTCSAGKTDLIIEDSGDLKICELMPKAGNLLEESPKNLLKSEQTKKIFKGIKKHKCDCTHICNISSGMNHNLKNVFLRRTIIDNFKKSKYFG